MCNWMPGYQAPPTDAAIFEGKTFVVSGVFNEFSRDELKKHIIDSSKKWFDKHEKQYKVFQLSK